MQSNDGHRLLDIQNVSKAFAIEGGLFRQSVGSVQALKDVSLSIQRGEKLALVGGSGCGKSTLAKIIVGLLHPDAGTLMWEGESLGVMTRLDRARKIQMVFQDPYASLNPKLSVGTQLSEVLRLTDGGKPEALLQSVGLETSALMHYPFQFSGGQRQRIAIARALAMKPQLLIADEPLSALDVTTQAKILDLFRSLHKEYGLTFLLITHDLAVADAFADRVIVLKEGTIVEEGAVKTVLTAPQHAYTKELVGAVPKIPW